MRAWRQHWNHQLYKALEHQYQTGLEALNKNLPEIPIDLTFKLVHTLSIVHLSLSLSVSLSPSLALCLVTLCYLFSRLLTRYFPII